MKRTPFLAIVLLAFAFPAHAQGAKQDAKQDAAVKPADPESKVVLDSWNEIGRKLTELAEDFPEDKYDFKPTPAQRSFCRAVAARGGLMLLLYEYCDREAYRGAGKIRKREQYKSKAEGHRCQVRQESLRRWRNRHPVEKAKKA